MTMMPDLHTTVHQDLVGDDRVQREVLEHQQEKVAQQVDGIENTLATVQCQHADVATVQRQILDRVIPLDEQVHEWHQNYQDYGQGEEGWPERCTVEFDLEGALGRSIEQEQLRASWFSALAATAAGGGGSMRSVATFGLASDGSKSPLMQEDQLDEENVDSNWTRWAAKATKK